MNLLRLVRPNGECVEVCRLSRLPTTMWMPYTIVEDAVASLRRPVRTAYYCVLRTTAYCAVQVSREAAGCKHR